MAKLIRRSVLLAKVESTYGTDAAPVAGTDAVLVENPSWGFTGQRMLEQPAVKHTLGSRQHIFGGTLFQVTCTVALKGSGTAGTPPEFGPLLRACGMGETIDTASVEYSPVSENLESVTLYYYEDGTLYKVVGCRGTFTLEATAGEYGKLNFTFTGRLAGESDSTISPPTYHATTPPPVISGGFSADGYAAVIAALNIDAGLQIATPPSVNAPDGYGDIVITGRDVTGSFDPEKVSKAAYDFIKKWQEGAAFEVKTGAIGPKAGNRWAVEMPRVSYRDIAPGDRDGIRTLENSFGAAEIAGDDELVLRFT